MAELPIMLNCSQLGDLMRSQETFNQSDYTDSKILLESHLKQPKIK